MIKQLVFIFWINLATGTSFAQLGHIYKSLDDALAVHPDSVFHLDLSRKQLKEIPKEILQFRNLIDLDLSKNKLSELPEGFVFEKLEVLNLTKNKFEEFPAVICKNIHLTQLFIGKNHLSELPPCIGDLTELVILDAWFNTISVIPESMTNLKKLRSFDVSGMNYSEDFQKKWRELMPWVEINFDVGCDCGL